jgi:hypothetical protein
MTTAQLADLPPRMRPDQACAFLGVTPHQLKRLRQQRKVRFYKLTATSLSYETTSLSAFLAAREVPTIGGVA